VHCDFIDVVNDPKTRGVILHNDLKVIKPKIQSEEDEPPKVKLKELPPHLEYAFLGNNGEWPVIIAKDLSFKEKTDLINVLKTRKKAIAWKLKDIKGSDLEFCPHKILLEEEYSPKVKSQRRSQHQTALRNQMMALQPHSSRVEIQDLMLDHQDKYMMKAQVHVSKSSAISDIQALPRRKYFYYQVVKHSLRGRLLASFQDLKHEDGDTRIARRHEIQG
nr:reverse transcriptase domain-containing protein [Tanacetum cinerariifolium]